MDPIWLLVQGEHRLVLGMVEAPDELFAARVVRLCTDRGLTASWQRMPRPVAEAIAVDLNLLPASAALETA